MKLITNYLLALLFTVLAALLAVSFMLPDRFDVEHTIVLDASPEHVYAYLHNPNEWPKWSVLSKSADPTVIHLYGGPTSGTGATMQWSGDQVGEGQLELTESISPTMLNYNLLAEGDIDTTHGSFILTKVSNGTQVLWKQSTPLAHNPVAKLVGVVRKYKKQQELEKGLNGLKNLLAANSKRSASK